MKIVVCDVCYKSDKTKVEATHRVGWKNGLKIDTCVSHRDFCRGKTQDEVAKWLFI